MCVCAISLQLIVIFRLLALCISASRHNDAAARATSAASNLARPNRCCTSLLGSAAGCTHKLRKLAKGAKVKVTAMPQRLVSAPARPSNKPFSLFASLSPANFDAGQRTLAHVRRRSRNKPTGKFFHVSVRRRCRLESSERC